jgi:hypothetical protein
MQQLRVSEDDFCARCRSLDRTSLAGPPFPLVTPAIYEKYPDCKIERTIHEFLRRSLQLNCRTCVQLLQLLDKYGTRSDRLTIWWNENRVFPSGGYVHSCRISGPEGYIDLSLVPIHVNSAARRNENAGEPELDYTGIKRWLRYCHHNHTQCATANQNTISLRVIDCKARALTMISPSCPELRLGQRLGCLISSALPAYDATQDNRRRYGSDAEAWPVLSVGRQVLHQSSR